MGLLKTALGTVTGYLTGSTPFLTDAVGEAVCVVLAVFLFAVVLDTKALKKMFVAVRWHVYINWLLSFVFLLSFVHLVSVQRQGLVLRPDDSFSRFCFVAVSMTFGYLLIFFAAIMLHDRTQRVTNGE
jgi:hypothetical protein